jgi:hypothetical protein
LNRLLRIFLDMIATSGPAAGRRRLGLGLVAPLGFFDQPQDEFGGALLAECMQHGGLTCFLLLLLLGNVNPIALKEDVGVLASRLELSVVGVIPDGFEKMPVILGDREDALAIPHDVLSASDGAGSGRRPARLGFSELGGLIRRGFGRRSVPARARIEFDGLGLEAA